MYAFVILLENDEKLSSDEMPPAQNIQTDLRTIHLLDDYFVARQPFSRFSIRIFPGRFVYDKLFRFYFSPSNVSNDWLRILSLSVASSSSMSFHVCLFAAPSSNAFYLIIECGDSSHSKRDWMRIDRSHSKMKKVSVKTRAHKRSLADEWKQMLESARFHPMHLVTE